MQELTHISLFAGIGGIDLAAEWAGFRTILFVEIDPFCQKVLNRHWPDVPMMGDVKDVTRQSVKERTGRDTVDIVSGGFPCQDISIAGKRGGLQAARSGLFFEMARIARESQPNWVVIENVAGLLTSNRGADFAIVLHTLEELGYSAAWRIIDARWCGVPQGRRRVFIVANPGRGIAAEVLDRTDGEFLEKVGGGLVSPAFTAAGNTNPSGGSGNNIVIGTLKAAGVRTMSGVGYVAAIEGEGPVSPGMREADGISRWLDGVVNEQVGNNGEDTVKGNEARKTFEESPAGFQFEGLQEELGEAVDRRGLYKIEAGDIPGQLLLALLPPSLQAAEDKRGLVEGQTGKQQGEGFEGDPDMGAKGVESAEVLGTPKNRGDSIRSQEERRYHALGNAVVPQQIYPILQAIADIENQCYD